MFERHMRCSRRPAGQKTGRARGAEQLVAINTDVVEFHWIPTNGLVPRRWPRVHVGLADVGWDGAILFASGRIGAMTRRFQFSLRALLVATTMAAGAVWATTLIGFPIVGLATSGACLIIAAAKADESLRGTLWPLAVCFIGVIEIEGALLISAVGVWAWLLRSL